MHQRTGIASFNSLHLIGFAVFFFVLSRTSATVNYHWVSADVNCRPALRNFFNFSFGSATAKKKINFFFLLFFLVCLFYYMILDTCLLIILAIICCLFIDMVENAGDDPGDRKSSVVNSIKIEDLIKVEASVKVKASSVNSDVWKLCDNEVDTAHFFPTRDTWKDKDELLGWVRRQENSVGFTVIVRISCEGRNAMLE